MPARSHGLLKRVLGTTLVASLIVSPLATTALAGRPSSAAVGGLSIASDPADAAVYVDGRFVGRTPVRVSDIPVGDHRVRVVKPGYLENSRVVGVSGGADRAVEIRLTPYTERAAAPAAQLAGGGGGGLLTNKWFLIGAAGAGVATAVLLMNRNHEPEIGSVAASPGTGLAAATTISFTAQGVNDEDDDPLTFEWDYGDGVTEETTGSTATHVYANAGTFTVRLTVSDEGSSASATTTVTIRNLTGTWTGQLQGLTTTTNLTQTGTTLTGTWTSTGFNATVAGTVRTATPQVTFTVTIPGFQPFTFTGNPNAEVSTLTGTANGSGFNNAAWNMSR
jgi:hypothetical protein